MIAPYTYVKGIFAALGVHAIFGLSWPIKHVREAFCITSVITRFPGQPSYHKCTDSACPPKKSHHVSALLKIQTTFAIKKINNRKNRRL